MRSKTVLFLLPYPLHRAPSQRFRVEAYFDTLRKQGIGYRTHTFISAKAWNILYQQGSALQKVLVVIGGFLKRLGVVLLVAPRYEYIFIHREAAPLGPPVFEWFLAKVLRKRLIYDFDDAIWIPVVSNSNKLAKSVKCCWKVAYICKWADTITAGNAYLAAYARNFNTKVTVLPTCVDTEARFNTLQQQDAGKVVIGWTGSHSTLPYLDAVVPVLQQLEQHFDFDFLVICNQPPAFKLRNLKFMQWREETEINDLLQMHIGLMPLQDDAWSEGKCGFKVIQYLSLGIPAVASTVGVNKDIIQEGLNGFLCAGEKAWYEALAALLIDPLLREKMGTEGRKKIVQSYSLGAHGAMFLNLFNSHMVSQVR